MLSVRSSETRLHRAMRRRKVRALGIHATTINKRTDMKARFHIDNRPQDARALRGALPCVRLEVLLPRGIQPID
jgi:hypothetical protein